MNIPQVTLVDIGKIQVDLSNPNSMKDSQFEALKENIKKYGFLVPLILNKEFVIADGEHRFLAAKDLGMTELPAVVLDINEVDRHILRQVMNKLKGEHDIKMDEVDYKWIYDNDGFDEFKKLLAITDKAEVQFLASITPVSEDDIPVVGVSSVMLGDVFQLGNHRVMCGDSTKKDDVEMLMNGKKVDLLITDPPYGVSYADKNAFLNTISPANRIEERILGDHNSLSDMKSLWVNCLKNAFEVSKPGTPYYVNSPQGGELMMMMMMSVLEAGWELKHSLIWVKNNIVLGRSDYNYQHEPILYGWKDGGHKFYGEGGSSSVWNIDKPYKSDLHPTMKPIELITKCINNSSKEGDIILDLFGGSGSTLIAAEQTNRICYMMEIEPKYCQIIINRFEKLTGIKVQKVN